MKNSSKQNPTTMMKGRFSNQVHLLLEPDLNKKRFDRKKRTLTDAEKIQLFDKIQLLHDASSCELTNYQFKRRGKKHVERERIKRGYVPKKQTTLSAWLKMQEAGEFLKN